MIQKFLYESRNLASFLLLLQNFFQKRVFSGSCRSLKFERKISKRHMVSEKIEKHFCSVFDVFGWKKEKQNILETISHVQVAYEAAL